MLAFCRKRDAQNSQYIIITNHCTNMLLVALVLAVTVRSNAACSDDEGCSLNGQCLANSTCSCYLPWQGDDCGLLAFLPAPTQGAYGDLPAPNNVTSWGGNAIFNGSVWVRVACGWVYCVRVCVFRKIKGRYCYSFSRYEEAWILPFTAESSWAEVYEL